MSKERLDKDEREILDAVESGAWEAIRPKEPELAHYAEIAKRTLRKDRRMNIRISSSDLNRLRAKAAEEGIPYQTLVAGILHKYAAGRPIAP
ncbi:MAG: antitoxin [Elusimicrobiota bacterium]